MSGRRITILVGTDHHGFDRLVRWADSHQAAHPADTVVIQHGHTSAPSVAAGVAFFSPEDLGRLAAESDVVITHGGPGTIMDVRKQGHRPITLARNPEHGEHVARIRACMRVVQDDTGLGYGDLRQHGPSQGKGAKSARVATGS